jgi:hypothetical protein
MGMPTVERLTVTEDTLRVELSDGRTLLVPLAWFPRLVHGTPEERANWRLIGRGEGIHWEDLDEDISVEGLLAGRPSGESQASFKQWLETRRAMASRLVGVDFEEFRTARPLDQWIPARRRVNEEELAALTRAVDELQALMAKHGITEEDVVREFNALRRQKRQSGRPRGGNQ